MDDCRSIGQDDAAEKKYLLARLEELLRLEKQQVFTSSSSPFPPPSYRSRRT
jgi:hypothetical protein